MLNPSSLTHPISEWHFKCGSDVERSFSFLLAWGSLSDVGCDKTFHVKIILNERSEHRFCREIRNIAEFIMKALLTWSPLRFKLPAFCIVKPL